MSIVLDMGDVRKFRYVKGEWRRVRWFPHVKVSVVDAGSDWVHVFRHDGKKFTAPDSTVGIQEALDDWAKTRLRLVGDLPLLRP